jgi:VWFA-related protein
MTPLWALTVALALLLAPPAAQQQQQKQQQKEEQLPVIKDIVELVNVLVTVKDKKGRLINTLEKKDFEVLEDGRPQEIRQFARETDLPLTIGLLVDTSPSQGRLIPAERDASITFLDTVLKTKDMAFLISFDSDVDLLQDFTNTRNLLRRGLDKLREGGGGVSGGPFPSTRTGGTHLYDAVYLAAAEKLATEVGRKTIVVVTDGEDQGSRVKIEAAIEAAQKADVIIYGVLLVDRAFYNRGGMMMGGYGGEGVLKKMAEETGGHMVRVDRERDLRAAFDELAAEMRSQYSLAYSPTNPKRDGGFRKLTVKVNQPDTRVQTRKGYYATPPTS